jgi:hypothetical protein
MTTKYDFSIKSELKKAALTTLLTASLVVGTIKTYQWSEPVYAKIAKREAQAPIKERDNLRHIYDLLNSTDYNLKYTPAGGSLLYGTDPHPPSTNDATHTLEHLQEYTQNPLTPAPLRKNLENITQDIITKLNQNPETRDSHGNYREFFSEREKLSNAKNQCEDYMYEYTKEIKKIPTINYIGKVGLSLLIMALGFGAVCSAMVSVCNISEAYSDLTDAIKMYDKEMDKKNE